MSGNRSFINYITDRFYNEFYSCLKNHIEEHQDSLDLNIQNVHDVAGVSLIDMEVKFASINDLPGMDIEFDVVLDAEIEVSEGDYHYDDYDLCNQWFLLSCSGNLEYSLNDFKINDIEVYTQRSNMDKPLSDALVPYVYSKDLESVATDFLKEYYPEALKTPVAIDPKELASRMELRVESRTLTKDSSIFGQIYFHNSQGEFYDSETDEMVIEDVEAGTIFVDPKIFFLRNLGAVNNTIVHECVHWAKHRKAFELERLYNEDLRKIKCQVLGGVKGSERTSTDWMEWHANALSPRIQMPLSTFKKRAFDLIKQYKEEINTPDTIDVIEAVIIGLEIYFGVSRIAAKIRMIDAGYHEAMGAFIYVNGKYIKPHSFKKGALKRNQTFSIPAEDAAIQSLIHPEIRNGVYIYVDSHFVLNHPKYVFENLLGEVNLTQYALSHMDECCLIFDLSIKSESIKGKYHTECYLNRDESSAVVFDISYNEGFQHATIERQSNLLEEHVLEEYQIYKKLTTDYRDCLKTVKDWRKLSYKKISEKTLIDEKTIRRIINGETTGSINTIVGLCLALKLPPRISFHIINNSPHSLDIHNNESHQWYDFALHHLYPKSMNEITSFLSDMGAEPL